MLAAPPYRDYIGDGYNIRGCQCLKDWEEVLAKNPDGFPGLCRCRGLCPKFVDPTWLTAARGQALCSLEESTGYNCYAECEQPESETIRWFATPCGGQGGQDMCDKPILAGRKLARKGEAAPAPAPEPAPPAPELDPEPLAPEPEPLPAAPEPEPEKPAPPPPQEPPPPANPLPPAPSLMPGAAVTWNPKEVWDLRGLQCELKDGKEQCFFEDEQGRELCPAFVTHEWLAAPKDQWLCNPENADKFYCTAGCQEGNDEVRWGAHEVSWCFQPQNHGSCPTRPSREYGI